MTLEQEIEMFECITNQMTKTFACKRHDYGKTTEETFNRFGPVSMLTRMYDKLGRLENLLVNNIEPYVYGEKVEDTLLDLANYAIITIMELRKREEEKVQVKLDRR